VVRRTVTAIGIEVAEVVTGIERAQTSNPDCRPALLQAGAAARRLGCPLVVTAISRLCRSWYYDASAAPGAMPTDRELADVLALLPGVEVAILANPYNTPAQTLSVLPSRS
jgi:hypothetical protein